MAIGSVALRRGLTKVNKPKYMGMVEEVQPLRLGTASSSKKKGASAAALATTAAVGTAAMADGDKMPKKGAPTAEAKGRRGGNIGTMPPPPQSSKKSIAEESDEEYRKIEADRIDRGLGPRSKEAKPSTPKKSAPSGKKGLSSFGSAFAAARAAGQSTFEFNGKKYNTMQKGETKEQHKAALSKNKSKLKPLKTVEQDKKDLAAKRAKDEARKKEVAAKVKAAGLAKGGMAKKKK